MAAEGERSHHRHPSPHELAKKAPNPRLRKQEEAWEPPSPAAELGGPSSPMEQPRSGAGGAVAAAAAALLTGR